MDLNQFHINPPGKPQGRQLSGGFPFALRQKHVGRKLFRFSAAVRVGDFWEKTSGEEAFQIFRGGMGGGFYENSMRKWRKSGRKDTPECQRKAISPCAEGRL